MNQVLKRVVGFISAGALFVTVSTAMASSDANAYRQPSMASLFVHAWMAELGPIEVPSGSVDAKFLMVAGLVHKGQFVKAEKLLDEIETEAESEGSSRDLLLALFFRDQLESRRYLLAAGGRSQDGLSTNNSMELELSKQEFSTKIGDLERRVSLDQRGEGFSLVLWQGALDFCALTATNLRTQRVYDRMSNSALAFTSKVNKDNCLNMLNMAKANKSGMGLGNTTDEKIISSFIEGDLAASMGDLEEAKQKWTDGLEFAKREGRKHSQESFMLRLGDLEASPYGNPLTMGYDLAKEDTVRFAIRMGGIDLHDLAVPFAQVPEAAQRRALEWYRKSAEIGSPNFSTYLLKARRANLAKLQRDYTLEFKLLSEAAAEAEGQDDVHFSAILRSYSSILAGNRGQLAAAIDLLNKAGDMGGILTVTETARSIGERILYLGSDVDRSTSTMKMIASVLKEEGLGLAAIPLYDFLSSAYAGTGNYDASLESSQNQMTLLSEAVRFFEQETEKRRPRVSPFDRSAEGWLARQKRSLTFNRMMIAMSLHNLDLSEGGDGWKKQAKEIETAVIAELRADDSKEGNDLLDHYMKFLRQKGALEGLRKMSRCTEYLEKYQELRPQIISSGNLQPLLEVLPRAVTCDPATGTAVVQDIAQVNPSAMTKEILQKRGTMEASNLIMALNDAFTRIEVFFKMALALKDYQQVLAWTEPLQAIVLEEPILARYRIGTKVYRALAAAGMQKPDEAKALLAPIMVTEEWNQFHPAQRSFVLSALVEANITSGDAMEGLVALNHLNDTEEEASDLRTGIRAWSKGNAESAMLIRKAAVQGGLSEKEAQRLKLLQDGQGMVPFFPVHVNQPHKSRTPANRTEISAAISSLPKNTTLLVYHIGFFNVTMWKCKAGEPVRMVRLETPVDDVVRLSGDLHDALANSLDWKAASKALYHKLLEAAGPFPAGDVIAIKRSSSLGNCHFEYLGASAEDILLLEHPVVYIDRLLGQNRPVAEGQAPTALVVGYGPVNAEKEAKEVSGKLKCMSLIGPDATAANVLKQIENAKWVHFASHAHLNEANPYKSTISLKDGDVEAWELFGNSAEKEMVLLSACDTVKAAGGGRVIAGMAGNESSIAAFARKSKSHWVVASFKSASDELTFKVMQRFYDRLISDNGQRNPARALQEAKKSLIKDKERPIRPGKLAYLEVYGDSLSVLFEKHSAVPANSPR